MRVFLLFFLSLAVFFSYAQPGQTINKKALAAFNKGLEAVGANNAQDAIKNLEKAIELDPGYIDPLIVLSQVYERLGDLDKTVQYLQKAIEINPAHFPEGQLKLAKLFVLKEDYEQAHQEVKAYLGQAKRRPERDAEARNLLTHTEFAKEAIKKPVEFTPVNLGEAINSKFGEYFPAFTGDDNSIYYTRKLVDASGRKQEDFYYSVQDNGKWKQSTNLGGPINTPDHNEGAPALSADGRMMVFTACDAIGDRQYGEGRTGLGSCDLFVSYRIGNKWSDPRNLGGNINSAAWESQPSLSADGRTLYFIRGYRNKTREITDMDIWYTVLQNGKWSVAEKVPGSVNTAGNESSVLIHPDGQTLYFTSDYHPGFGGEDIFVSRLEDDKWGKPVNLGYPINTADDENSVVVAANGTVAYFASDRPGGLGDVDLYSFNLPEPFRPVKVSYMKGIVVDKQTKKPLEAVFRLIDLHSKKEVIQSVSDKITGEFLVNIAANKDYALNVSSPGYLFYSENFALKESSFLKPTVITIELQPISAGQSVVLKNVFFDTDKYELKPESEVELDKLYEFLSNNPSVRIELSGHTDNQGDDAHNQELSENRAKAVHGYLVKKGVDPQRLQYKGYGETQPVAGNDTEAGRATNRRTEFRIL